MEVVEVEEGCPDEGGTLIDLGGTEGGWVKGGEGRREN